MIIPTDFRRCNPDKSRVRICGVFSGELLYPKLYFIENVTRIVVHSVLTLQLPPPWFAVAVDQDTANRVQVVRADYAANPRNASAGPHDVYYLFLPKLTGIIRTHFAYFQQAIPSADDWVDSLDAVRLPRNLVGHMNWPNSYDRAAIKRAHAETKKSLRHLQQSVVPVLVP